MQNEMIFVIRVKMPDGDEEAKNNAIFDVKPQGFEVKWPFLGQNWPIDCEGFTWVPLFPYSVKDALVNSIDRECEMRSDLRRLKESIKNLV